MAPVIVAVLPAVALIAGGVFTVEGKARVAALLVGAAGLLVCALVRDAGHRAQTVLWRQWGGSPTLRRIRFRDTDHPERVERLHARLSATLGIELPTVDEEADDPDAADDRYNEAVADLRQLTRDGGAYEVLAAENAEYGFRRNLYGIRPFALAIAWTSGLTAGVLFGLSTGTVERRALFWGPGVLTAIGCIALHLRIGRPAWVRLAGERYTDRLFEAARSVAPDAPDERKH